MLQTTAPDRKEDGPTFWFVALGLVAALHALVLLWQGVGPVDDDYIVYRYARHWIESGAFAFNSVEASAGQAPVEGFTSPLWLCLCALAQVLSIAPEVWTPAVGVVSTGLATLWAGLAMRAAVPLSAGRWALIVPVLMALSPSLAWHAIAGLGTAPMTAAIALAVLAAVRGRVGLFALASVVAVAFRLEALVVLLPLGVAAGSASSDADTGEAGFSVGRAAQWIAPALVALGVVTLVRWWLFGRLAPSTYFVKRLPVSEELGYGARYLLRTLTEGGLATLAFAALIATSKSRPSLARGLSVGSVLALVYVLACGGDWMVYGRFLVPFLPVFAVGAGFLVLGWEKPLSRMLLAAVLVLSVAAGLRPDVRSQAIFEHRYFEAWWLRVGDGLRERAPKGSSIGLSPIGAIGWRSGLEVVDILGLTHDEFHGVAPDLKAVSVKGHHRHNGAWVLDQEPTYLLLGNAVLQSSTGSIDVNPWEADIVANPRFQRDYVAETAWVSELDGGRSALPYFRRRGAPKISPEIAPE